MALRMVALVRRNGHWFARKGIPQDVRDEYARLYGVRYEAQLKLSGDMPHGEAKIRNAEWTAEIETRIARSTAHKAKRHCAGGSLVHLVYQTARGRSGATQALERPW